MFCKNCGKEIEDNRTICPHCGRSTGATNNNSYNPEDSGSAGWGVLGFLFPLIGLILYILWKDTKPRSAHVAGKGALIGVIVSVAFSVLSVLLVTCGTCLAISQY